MEPFAIRTRRLLIREWREDDVEAFQRIVSAPEVSRWFGPRQPDPVQPSFVERMRRNQRDLGWALWAVELRGADADVRRPIGYAGFGTESLPDPELAWAFHPSVWGHGYATEAGVASRDYGFEVLHMARMVSVVDERNSASARVAEKVGLIATASTVCYGVPHVVYEIDVERWQGIRDAGW